MKPLRQMTVVAIVAVGVIAAAVVLTFVSSRKRHADKPQSPLPIVPMPPAEVRVKAVERKTEPVERGEAALASGAVAIVCGADKATANRYEARNDARRSIARRRDLPENNVAALVRFLASAKDPLPVECVAALKNDVMNRSSAMRVPSVYTKLLHFVKMCISKTMHFVVITHFKNRAFRDYWLTPWCM